MNAPSPDRKIAQGVVAVAALILAIVIAGSPKARRSNDVILREVVQLLELGDQQDARVDYENVRLANGRRNVSAITTWFRSEPMTRLVLAGGALQIQTDGISAQCFDSRSAGEVVGEASEGSAASHDERGMARCLPRVRTPDGKTSEAFFVAVRIRKAYVVSDIERREIAGESARCFRFTLASGRDPIGALGDRTELCLSHRGVLLMSTLEVAGRVDQRTAKAVSYQVDSQELDRVVRQYAESR